MARDRDLNPWKLGRFGARRVVGDGVRDGVFKLPADDHVRGLDSAQPARRVLWGREPREQKEELEGAPHGVRVRVFSGPDDGPSAEAKRLACLAVPDLLLLAVCP